MRKILLALALFALIASAAADQPLATGMLSTGDEYLLDRFIVTMHDGTQPLNIYQSIDGIAITGNDEIDQLCLQNNIVAVEKWYDRPVKSEYLRSLTDRMYVFKVAEGVDAKSATEGFLDAKDVEYSDLWLIGRLFYTPNDPSHNNQWALNKISAYGAWDLIRGDTTKTVIVGIDDTGVYYQHPDLEPNMWINGPEDLNGNGIFDASDVNGQDEDGNGYPDDLVGWDFGQADNNPQEIIPEHGTHVAGCASEATDNNIGGAGPGFSAKLMALKITNAAGQLTHGYPAMIYAADNGCDIINCSWGNYYYNPSYQNIINYCFGSDVAVVAAAGNDNTSQIGYPAGYANVFCVASTDQGDVKSYFSNYGSYIDISAPGEFIYSTWGSNSYSYEQGTSMASPIVAGAMALLKAQNPSWTPNQLYNTIMVTADDIDDINPNYAGQLGGGRINIHSALGAGQYPNIQLVDYSEQLVNDDGDGVVNPGESIDLTVTMENLWQDADGVSLTLHSTDGLVVTDSVSDLGFFEGGGSQLDNSSDPFTIVYDSDAVPGYFTLFLTINATSPAYNVERELTVSISLNLTGFPVSIADAIESHPLIVDLDLNSSLEIVFGCNDASVYAIKSNGSNLSGWPVSTSDDVSAAVAVGDIDNSGDYEVVAAAGDGNLYAWDHQGNLLSGFPITTGGALFAGPTLIDFDGNGDYEIVMPNFQTRNVDVYNHDGSAFGDWPYTATQGWYASGAVGDIDGNGQMNYVIGGFDSNVHVFKSDKSEVSGFPVALDNRAWAAPAIGNIDPSDAQPEIVIGTQTGNLYLINHDGSMVSGFPIDVGTPLKSTATLADLDSDGSPEILFGGSDSKLYAYDSDGSQLSGFPITLLANVAASPVVADIDGDNSPDILIANGSAETYLYGFNSAGETLPNFPIPTSAFGSVLASPAVWDIDFDGDMDIVVGVQNSGDNLDVFDYKAAADVADVQWPFYGKDKYRSVNYGFEDVVSVDDNDINIPVRFGLNQNYPNPFNNHTVISFSLEKAANITLEVYDILGRHVRLLDSGQRDAGTYSVTWDGMNEDKTEVSSGVYFYRLKADDNSSVKRMLYLR